KEDEVVVKGTATPNTEIKLINNKEEIEQVNVNDNGEFNTTLALGQGENQLKAVSYVEDTYAGESETITVILDNQNPDLTIETPKNGRSEEHTSELQSRFELV